MTTPPRPRVALLGLFAALFACPAMAGLPAPAGALPLYFTVPDADREPFPGQPTLLYTLTPGDRPQLIGPITLDGVAEAISAIALSPHGELIGFIEGQGTLVVTIDPLTAVADPGPVPVVLPTLIAGAAFAPDGRLWVLDLFDQLARPLDDGALGPPSFLFPDELGGADLIFDGDGRCYFTGVTFAGASAGLHRCDVDTGTLERIGDWQDQGFDAIAVPSGLAVGPGADPCIATLYAIDGGDDEEIGRADLAAPLALRAIASLGADFAAAGFPDAAGFFARPDTPECALPVEDCTSSVDDDGDDAIDCADTDCREHPACEGIAARPPRPGDLVITEILYDPIAVDDTTGEFIELHNPGRGRIELRGLRIGDNTGDDAVIINRSLIVPPGGFVIAARSADPARNGGLNVDIVLGDALALGNTTDRVRLTYGNPRVIIAEVSYDEGTGWPSAAGASLQYGAEHDPLAADRADPARWCLATARFGAGDLGTPGAPNTRCQRDALPRDPVDYCRLHDPPGLVGPTGDRATAYGRLLQAGVTDRTGRNDPDPAVSAQLGYLVEGIDPTRPGAWTWVDAAPNPAYAGGEPVLDEYRATLTLPAPGRYRYAFRFTVDGGTSYTLCDLDGAGSLLDGGDGTSFSLARAGLMQVDRVPCEPDCEPIVECGNGIIEPGEDCDEPDLAARGRDGDGCSADCRAEVDRDCDGSYSLADPPADPEADPEADAIHSLVHDNCPGAVALDCTLAENRRRGPHNPTYDPEQRDHDGDGAGDVCDDDDDDDGVPDALDRCPRTPDGADAPGLDGLDNDRDDRVDEAGEESQRDYDGDGRGDRCDVDSDADGIADHVIEGDAGSGAVDNCRFLFNPEQTDLDGDGIGDPCDPDADDDGALDCGDDGLCDPTADAYDNDVDGRVDERAECPTDDGCRTDANLFDDDGDGSIDERDEAGLDPLPYPGPDDDGSQDNCPGVANPDQRDTDRDGRGDACDAASDRDGDGIDDDLDNCPDVANGGQRDADGDGIGDACEDDIDGDGVTDDRDNCPAIANPDQTDSDRDGDGDACDDDLDAGEPSDAADLGVPADGGEVDEGREGIDDGLTDAAGARPELGVDATPDATPDDARPERDAMPAPTGPRDDASGCVIRMGEAPGTVPITLLALLALLALARRRARSAPCQGPNRTTNGQQAPPLARVVGRSRRAAGSRRAK